MKTSSKAGFYFIGIIVLIGLVIGLANIKPKQKTTQQDQTATETTVPQPTQNLEQIEPNLIKVTASGFSPATLTIKPGEKVVWLNQSGKNVVVASADHPTHRKYPPLNLGEFADKATIQLVFDKAGTYKYHNHLSPDQTGTVIVK